MITKKLIIREANGLHARPAARIVKTCKELDSKVTLGKDCNKADGCSIIQMLLLSAGQGAEIEVTVEGGDEELAITRITELFENGGGI